MRSKETRGWTARPRVARLGAGAQGPHRASAMGARRDTAALRAAGALRSNAGLRKRARTWFRPQRSEGRNRRGCAGCTIVVPFVFTRGATRYLIPTARLVTAWAGKTTCADLPL